MDSTDEHRVNSSSGEVTGRKSNTDYEYIRAELISLKNCMTTYIGFVLGGAGASFIGLAAVTQRGTLLHNTVLFCALMLSFLVSLVLLVLMYKFNSHNRLAGYGKLLNQELISNNQTGNNSFCSQPELMSWEICMNILRESDFDAEMLTKAYDLLPKALLDKNIRESIQSMSGNEPKCNKRKKRNGIRLWIMAISGKLSSKSWMFPMYVVTVFFIVEFLYFSIAIHILITNFTNSSILGNSLTIFFILAAMVVQSYMWTQFFGKLYTLMEGSSTVEAFCTKFLPIRYLYIKFVYPDVKYELATKEKVLSIN